MILLARFKKDFSTTDIIDGLTVKEELICVRNRMKIKWGKMYINTYFLNIMLDWCQVWQRSTSFALSTDTLTPDRRCVSNIIVHSSAVQYELHCRPKTTTTSEPVALCDLFLPQTVLKHPSFWRAIVKLWGPQTITTLAVLKVLIPPKMGKRLERALLGCAVISWSFQHEKFSERHKDTVSLLRQGPKLFYGSSTVCLHTVSSFQVSSLQGWAVTGPPYETRSSALARIYSLRCTCSQTVTRPFRKHVFYFKLLLVTISMIAMD